MTVAEYLAGKIGKREFNKLLDKMNAITVKEKK